jgi:hypothetical protein
MIGVVTKMPFGEPGDAATTGDKEFFFRLEDTLFASDFGVSSATVVSGNLSRVLFDGVDCARRACQPASQQLRNASPDWLPRFPEHV